MKLITYLNFIPTTTFIIIWYQINISRSELVQTTTSGEHFYFKDLKISTSLSPMVHFDLDNGKIQIKKRKKRKSSTHGFDLKNLLKNSESMSLSEILQQKNLSLQDLLTGENSALQAIQSTISPSISSSLKIARPPNNRTLIVGFEKHDNVEEINSKFQEPQLIHKKKETLTLNDKLSKKTEDTFLITMQSKDLTRKNNAFQSRFKQKNSITTKKPYVDFNNYTQEIKIDSPTFFSDSSKLQNKSLQQAIHNIQVEKGNNKFYGLDNFQIHKNRNGFTTQSKYISTPVAKTIQITTDSSLRTFTEKDYKNKIETNAVFFLDLQSGSNFDERSELLELITDGRSSSRLFKVLNQRNMTLDELIEHRKRGSSQLHLSQVLNDKSSFIKSQLKLKQNLDIVTAFENFPHFNFDNIKSIIPRDIKTDSNGNSYFTSISSEIAPGRQQRDGIRSFYQQKIVRSNKYEKQNKTARSVIFVHSHNHSKNSELIREDDVTNLIYLRSETYQDKIRFTDNEKSRHYYSSKIHSVIISSLIITCTIMFLSMICVIYWIRKS